MSFLSIIVGFGCLGASKMIDRSKITQEEVHAARVKREKEASIVKAHETDDIVRKALNLTLESELRDELDENLHGFTGHRKYKPELKKVYGEDDYAQIFEKRFNERVLRYLMAKEGYILERDLMFGGKIYPGELFAQKNWNTIIRYFKDIERMINDKRPDLRLMFVPDIKDGYGPQRLDKPYYTIDETCTNFPRYSGTFYWMAQ